MIRACPEFWLLLLITLLLTGCGFHLHGMADVPSWLDNTSVIVEEANADTGILLRKQLQLGHVRVNPDPQSATYWLVLESDGFEKDISSISSSTSPRQYQLIYKVQFKLLRAKGEPVIPSGNVIVIRQVTINNKRILGSSNEEQDLKQQMRLNAISQILNRIHKTKSLVPVRHVH